MPNIQPRSNPHSHCLSRPRLAGNEVYNLPDTWTLLSAAQVCPGQEGRSRRTFLAGGLQTRHQGGGGRWSPPVLSLSLRVINMYRQLITTDIFLLHAQLCVLMSLIAIRSICVGMNTFKYKQCSMYL